MAKRNVKKVLLGVVLLIIAGASAAAAFYFLEINPQFLTARFGGGDKGGYSQNPREEKGVDSSPLQENGKEAGMERGPVEPSLPQPRVVNGLTKREGFLWVDRKSSKMVVTLGKVDGLLPGKSLIVYEGQNRIGQVIVGELFETVSHVYSAKESANLLKNNYYRVVIE